MVPDPASLPGTEGLQAQPRRVQMAGPTARLPQLKLWIFIPFPTLTDIKHLGMATPPVKSRQKMRRLIFSHIGHAHL